MAQPPSVHDFLEEHEREELKRITRDARQAARRSAITRALTCGPLLWYWRAFPWFCVMSLFVAGAIFFSNPNPLPIIGTVVCAVQAVLFGALTYGWVLVRSTRHDPNE